MRKECLKTIVATWAVAGLCLSQPAMAQKRIAYLRNNTAANYATHDGNITKFLGSAGITIGSVTIPGLGYQIIEYQHGAEPDPITTAVADLIFVSETIASGSILYHTDDPVPIIMCEQALYNDDAPPRCEMFFSDGAGSLASGTTFYFNVTDNTHPITAVFPLGLLRVFNTGELGYMTPPMATAVLPLAYDPTNPSRPCLAVAEKGATGFRAGGTGNDPAPARRVCVGFHLDSMSNPTSSGVYLMQRTVQWAMGDPVTAGEPGVTTPSAPTNLRAQPGDGMVRLDWRAPSGTVIGYRVFQSQTAGGPYTAVTTTTLLMSDVTGLTNDVRYYFVVRAFNAAGEGPNSLEASAMPQAGLSAGTRRWRDYD